MTAPQTSLLRTVDDAAPPFRPLAPLAHPTSASDRAAMGYPDAFVAARLPDHLSLAEGFMSSSRQDLLDIIADPARDLADRLGAATRLNMLGDPRVVSEIPEMIEVAGGEVPVGLDPDQVDDVISRFDDLFLERSWIEKECPRHLRRLARHRIARYPVTNREYRDFLQDSGYGELPTSWPLGRYPSDRGNHPVYTVTAEAAATYALWLAQRTGRKFRLPDEAEWEHAAGGPQALEFPWGQTFNSECANTIESGLLTSVPIGIYPQGRSPFGLDDMAGNVEEYVAGHYAPYPGGTEIADDLALVWPAGYAVARGGGFSRFRDLARCRRRHGLYPRPLYAIGFRLAEDVS
ncbi:SUMF1/EgtB/PvdO family nonheme iron enzyme [Stappia sp. ES.058]|uniref:formylglycine-generating enzyme family protein n=1 Tax=Stappia sp. ES.058 TaxID=1881061 RepID=UPI00087ADFB9|nr:SUMF1/EgtB/PvdO family nonheme iron enzyme [Stappia sp. ES.058]SDU44225.1 Formylglycine-generating enzyme, required for sulfatase activity, contains SUMF1/FGE domain [Stappia sp. ES.058]